MFYYKTAMEGKDTLCNCLSTPKTQTLQFNFYLALTLTNTPGIYSTLVKAVHASTPCQNNTVFLEASLIPCFQGAGWASLMSALVLGHDLIFWVYWEERLLTEVWGSQKHCTRKIFMYIYMYRHPWHGFFSLFLRHRLYFCLFSCRELWYTSLAEPSNSGEPELLS